MSTISSAVISSTRSPWNVMDPSDGRLMPEIVRRVVDFPAPFPPMSVTSSPSSTRTEMPLTASIPPYRTLTSLTSSSVSAID